GPGRVAQLELVAGQGDHLRHLEYLLVEGDDRVPRGGGVGEADGLAQAQEARARGDGIAGRVHDQGREGRAGIRELEGAGQAGGGRDHAVAADDVVGCGDEGGRAVGDDGRRGREDRRGAIGRGLGDEGDDAPVDRLDRVLGRYGHGQGVGERRADRRRL